jgi:DNA polymerase-3 subunit delta
LPLIDCIFVVLQLPFMTYASLYKDLQAGKYAPVYFFHGEEPFYIDSLTRFIEKNALPTDQQAFNQTVLYGGDTNMLSIVGEAKRYPMMADRVVILVKEAQHIRDWTPLERYLEQPQPSTVLVFAYKYKKPDKRKKVFKQLSNASVYFESAKVREWNLAEWINTHAKTKGYGTTHKAAHLIAESLGTDLGRIDSELDKLKLVVKGGGVVDEVVVEQNIGISKDYNNFELLKALASKDLEKALRIQKYFAANSKDNPLVLTLGLMFNFYSKMLMVAQSTDKSERGIAKTLRIPPFAAKDYVMGQNHYRSIRGLAAIIDQLRTYDLRAKGKNNGQTPDGELLKELLLKIMYQ